MLTPDPARHWSYEGALIDFRLARYPGAPGDIDPPNSGLPYSISVPLVSADALGVICTTGLKSPIVCTDPHLAHCSCICRLPLVIFSAAVVAAWGDCVCLLPKVC